MGVIDLNSKELIAGMTSGIKTHKIDAENKTVTINFNNDTSVTIQVNTSKAKIERVLAAFMEKDTTLVKVNEFKSKVESFLKEDISSEKGTIASREYVEKYDIGPKVTAYLVENNITWLTPEMFGAIGDGETDDSDAMVSCFLQAKSANLPIRFGYKKNYVVNKPLTLANNSVIDGNFSKLTINGYTATSRVGYWFVEYSYGNMANEINWYDLDILVSFSEVVYSTSNTSKALELNLFQILFVKKFILNNVSIEYEGDERNSINFFKLCRNIDYLRINDCYFKNPSHSKIGSILWLQAGNSKGFPDAVISNTYFYSENWDEIMSIYRSGLHNVTFDNCYFEQNTNNVYYDLTLEEKTSFTGPFFSNILQGSVDDGIYTGLYHRTCFKNCTMKSRNLGEDNTYTRIFTACASQYENPIEIVFDNCDIDVEKSGFGGESTSTIQAYEDNNTFARNCIIKFLNCNIKMYTWFLGKSNCANLLFDNCKIEKNNQLIKCSWLSEATASHFHTTIQNSDITIHDFTEDVPLITLMTARMEKYFITNNRFMLLDSEGVPVSFNITEDNILVETTTNYGYDTGTKRHAENASYRFFFDRNLINHNLIDTINKS